jgi:hypothetical protein
MLIQLQREDTSPTGSLTRTILRSGDRMGLVPLPLVPLPTPIPVAMRTTTVAASYRPAHSRMMAMP